MESQKTKYLIIWDCLSEFAVAEEDKFKKRSFDQVNFGLIQHFQKRSRTAECPFHWQNWFAD
jgi:hypothetical protein